MTTTATAAAPLARCDAESCGAWRAPDQLEQIGRLSFCRGRCSRWEWNYRKAEATARRAAIVAQLTPAPTCQPTCLPCERGVPNDGSVFRIDGKPFSHVGWR